MHNCEEFRERITELIIDREDLAARAEFQTELLMCSSCSEFYVQSQEMIEALDEIDLTISENQWNDIESRMCDRITVAASNNRLKSGAQRSASAIARSKKRSPLQWGRFIAVAALLLITVGLSRLATPTTEPQKSRDNAQAIYVEHTVPLDPVTVDFLEESELLLRNVMKMTPHDTDDLADAKKVASEQLAELDQRKEAAVDIPPVVSVMETYETILRDLRNVDERSADEDMGDIRKRIQQNGLIANMKAFQPRVTEVGFSLR
jgi:hypothetical protein